MRTDKILPPYAEFTDKVWSAVGSTLLVSLGAGLSVANAVLITTGGAALA